MKRGKVGEGECGACLGHLRIYQNASFISSFEFCFAFLYMHIAFLYYLYNISAFSIIILFCLRRKGAGRTLSIIKLDIRI